MQLHTELLYHPAVPLLGIYPRERKNPCVNVNSSSIHNCPKLEMIRTSFNWWMKIQSLCASLQYLNPQQWKRVNYCGWQNHRWILLIHGSQTQKAGCVIPFICLIWKRQNFVDREKISDCWRLGVGGRVEYKGQNEGIFGIERIVLYHCGDVVMVMDIWLCISQKKKITLCHIRKVCIEDICVCLYVCAYIYMYMYVYIHI